MATRSANRAMEWWTDQGISVVVITVLTVLIGVVLSEIQNRIGMGPLLMSLSTVVIVFVTISVLYFRYIHSVALALSDEVSGQVRQITNIVGGVESGSENLAWLTELEHTVEYERESLGPEIWLITADLEEDSMGGPFQEVVGDNLRRGVKYHYFVPNEPMMKSRVGQLKAIHENHPGLSFTYLNDDFFFLVPRFDFAIYNPYCVPGGTKREAFMGIPVDPKYGRFEAKVNPDLIDVLIGKLPTAEVERP